MVWTGKKNLRSKRTYGRRGRKNNLVKMVKNIASKIAFGKKEIKHYDMNANGSIGTVGVAGNIQELTFISQGDTELQRDGLEIYHNSVHVDLNFVAADAYNKLRVILFKWDDDTPPVLATLFAPGYTTYVQTPYSWPIDPKFKILYDRKIDVDADDPAKYVRFYKKLYGKCKFTGSGQGTGIKGRIYLAVMSDSGIAPHPTCTGYVRYTFRD